MAFDLFFRDQRNRNQRAKMLRAQGMTVQRFSVRNQLLHPNYVEDSGEWVDNGFGNAYSQTFWSVLYGVKVLS